MLHFVLLKHTASNVLSWQVVPGCSDWTFADAQIAGVHTCFKLSYSVIQTQKNVQLSEFCQKSEQKIPKKKIKHFKHQTSRVEVTSRSPPFDGTWWDLPGHCSRTSRRSPPGWSRSPTAPPWREGPTCSPSNWKKSWSTLVHRSFHLCLSDFCYILLLPYSSIFHEWLFDQTKKK